MRLADLLTTGVLMLLGGVVLYDALRLGTGWGTDGPRSGFFPFWLAVFLFACSTVVLLQTLFRPSRLPFVTRQQLGLMGKVLIPAVGMVVLTQLIGLYAAAAVYVGFYMRWVGRHSWLMVVAVAIGVPVLSFVVFEHWFLSPLPKGPLESWLGY
jgi:putative tricarboxylic transport membrane protein